MRRAVTVLGTLAGALLFWLLAVWPPPIWFRSHWPRATAFMTRPAAAARSRGARARGRLYHPVPLDSITPQLPEAVMIGEDANFLNHHGIDFVALAQALGYRRPSFDWHDAREREELLALLPRAWSRRDRLRGASTITQQLAKNLYLSPSRNPLRKVKEAVIAWRLEAALGKQRIMELYLNVVELGDDVWGVESASELYFHRPASALSLDEAAALAGTLPFPHRSNPEFRPGRMRWRQNLILRRMQGEQVVVPTPVEDDSTAAETVTDSTVPAPIPDSLAAVPPSQPDSAVLPAPVPDTTAAADSTP
jgi:monofunctional biosynthetic peptidoglycan transglycosylase